MYGCLPTGGPAVILYEIQNNSQFKHVHIYERELKLTATFIPQWQIQKCLRRGVIMETGPNYNNLFT